MTPKEKAEELLGKFNIYADGIHRQEDQDQIEEHIENCKQCALICVEEMETLYRQLASFYIQGENPFKTGLNYWEQVKTEIEKV